MKKSSKTASYVFIILAISAALVVLLLATTPKPIEQSRKTLAQSVDVVKVRRHNLLPVETQVGRLQPAKKAKLRFEIAGQIAKRHVEPGQTVVASQVLLSLDNGDYHDAVVQAKAQHTLESASIQRDIKLLALAKHNSALQAKEVKRLKRLGKGALVSKSRLGEAIQRLYQLQAEEARLKYSVETAEARLALKKAALERAKRNLKRTELKAPFTGVVNSVEVQAGDFVSTSKIVVEIISAGQVEIYLQVRNRTASALKLGDHIDVTINGKQFQGRLLALQADPDASTYTHALRIALPEHAGKPGELAQVQLRLAPLNQVIAIPILALAREKGSSYVMVVKNKTSVERRTVLLGERVNGLQVIRAGLQAGEMVAVGDLSSLKSGQAIAIRKIRSELNVSKQ